MSHQSRTALIGVLFVVSGAIGLVYQIVWFKYLALFLGNTTYAQTIVLATFMGGLAIGAAVFGRRADSARNPLSIYAWLELGIGVYCLLYPTLTTFLRRGVIGLVQTLHLSSDGVEVLGLKLVASLLTLLLPTILMGGTLPVLVRFVSRRMDEAGTTVATLYFLNSFGAVVGSLLGGFFLVRLLGLSSTIYAAAALNLIIGVAALLLAGSKESGTEPTAIHSAATEPMPAYSDRQRRIAVLVAGISGAASMIYEVTWVRLLIPVLGSSTYSFSLMLVGFISGITIGSLIVSSRIDRTKNLFRLLALCQMAVAVSLMLTLPLYARIPYDFWGIAHILTRSDATYPLFLITQFVFGLSVMIVPTIFLGMSLPIATRIVSKSISVLGRSVGNVFSINTIGTVIGSLAAGLVMIPLIGVKHTIEAGVLLNAGAGLMLVLQDTGSSVRMRSTTIAVAAIAGVGYILFSPDWSRGAMLSGVFRHINRNDAPPASFREFRSTSDRTKILFYKEGTTATVGVIEGESVEGIQNVLIINGKADASSKGDLPTQVLLGQFPTMLHPNPVDALVIGFGSGVTVGSILTHPVRSVDCVEISPEVMDASVHFKHVNNNPLDDPRTRVYVEDALAFLQFTDKTYDVVVSEPSNPWIAGIGSLYTQEFFRQCSEKMSPNGIMVQWFHLYEMNDEIFRLVLRTFRSSFTHVTVWQSLSADIILMGSNVPLAADDGVLGERMSRAAVRADLARIMVHDPATLLSMQFLSERAVRMYAGSGELNLEDQPRLEYAAPRAFFVNQGVTDLTRFDERMQLGQGSLLLSGLIHARGLTIAERVHIGSLHASNNRGNPMLGISLLSSYVREHPADVDALNRLADVCERMRQNEDHLHYRKRLAELRSNDPATLEKYAWLKFNSERRRSTMIDPIDAEESIRLIRRAIDLTRDTVDRFRVRLADMFFGLQQYSKALDQYARALSIRESHDGDPGISHDALLLQLARCFYQTGQRDKAISYAFQAARHNPSNQEAKDLVYDAWMGGEVE